MSRRWKPNRLWKSLKEIRHFFCLMRNCGAKFETKLQLHRHRAREKHELIDTGEFKVSRKQALSQLTGRSI